MNLRNRVQIHITVNTGETEEILILAPASARPFENLRSQFIFALFQIRGQFKLGRSKRILAVAKERSVQPYGNTALCSLEGNKKPFSFHLIRHFKIFHIGSRRIESLRNLTRFYFFSSFPRILHIGILRCVVSLHLDMRRHADIIPFCAVILRCLKSRNRALVVLCVVEFPQSVQTVTEVFHMLLHFFHRSIIPVIGMRRYPVLSIIRRVLHFFILKYTHFYFPPSGILFSLIF